MFAYTGSCELFSAMMSVLKIGFVTKDTFPCAGPERYERGQMSRTVLGLQGL